MPLITFDKSIVKLYNRSHKKIMLFERRKMYIKDGNYHLINNLPAYGSLIITKNSGGIGGEIYFKEDEKAFFNTTGKIILEQGKTAKKEKQLYELHPKNIYTFDFENLYHYLFEIEDEFENHTLNSYKNFNQASDSDKQVNSQGLSNRKQFVLAHKDDLTFKLYLKKSTNNRCFIGSADANNIYTKIIAYTVIPNYTTMTIQRIDQKDGGAKYIFRLFFCHDLEEISENNKQEKKETLLKTEKNN